MIKSQQAQDWYVYMQICSGIHPIHGIVFSKRKRAIKLVEKAVYIAKKLFALI